MTSLRAPGGVARSEGGASGGGGAAGSDAVADLPACLGGTPLFAERLRFVRPLLPPPERLHGPLREMMATGVLTNGPYVRELERRARERLEADHVVAVSSCTSGLILALKGLGARGEAIVPSFTFSATGHALAWNGLAPRFVDCEPETLDVDPARVRDAIGPRTGAIVGVAIYGNPPDMEALAGAARGARAPLVIDAAHAFGSVARAGPMPRLCDAAVYSLTPTKPVVGGEGGLVATRHSDLAQFLAAARNYGDAGDYDCAFAGFNARMQEFSAALALETLGTLEQGIARRTAIRDRYVALLGGLPGVRFPVVRAGDRSTHKDSSLVLDPGRAGLAGEELQRALLADGVDTRRYFSPPLHLQKCYRGLEGAVPREGLPHTEAASRGVVSLPVHPLLTDAEVDLVARAVRRVLAAAPRVREALAKQPPPIPGAP